MPTGRNPLGYEIRVWDTRYGMVWNIGMGYELKIMGQANRIHLRIHFHAQTRQAKIEIQGSACHVHEKVIER